MCLVGDAAHATAPHHGAGAGFCIEDAAVLAHILSDPRVSDARTVEAALATYDASRRERGSWLVQSSRRIGNTYEWLTPGIEEDLEKIKDDIEFRNGVIANVDVQAMCDAARNEFHHKFKAMQREKMGQVCI